MKTTVDITDALLEQAKELAHRRGCTLRSLLEQALHQLLKDDADRKAFSLRDASVGGGWLTEEASARSMTELIHGTYDRPFP